MNKSSIRIGCVPYLNAQPLVAGLEKWIPPHSLLYAEPSQLACMLEAGQLDIALVSSVEYLTNPWQIFPGVGIVSRGAVNSVILTFRCHPSEVKVVDLDPASLTSNVLTMLWLEQVCEIKPRYRLATGYDAKQTDVADACLRIGDRGLALAAEAEIQIDLGQAWQEWTGLPFVYAAWMVRPGVRLNDLVPFFKSGPERAIRQAAQIGQSQAGERKLDPDRCVHYLANLLSYQLEESATAGLLRFYNLALASQERIQAVFPRFGKRPHSHPGLRKRPLNHIEWYPGLLSACAGTENQP